MIKYFKSCKDGKSLKREYISPSVMDEKELENAISYEHILNYNQMESLSKE